MVEILRTDYISESTEDLIKRAEQILADPRIYPRTDDIIPYSRSGFGFMNQENPYPRIYPRADDIIPYSRSGFGFMTQSPSIRTLSPGCNRIEVKNTITVTDSSIVTCTGSGTGTCTAIPGTCPSTSPTTYVNMVAIVDALVAQNSVTIKFEYILNDVPTTTDVVVNLTAGPNTVYCFATNQQYPANTTLALFGARVV